jgi:hypothetical protein
MIQVMSISKPGINVLGTSTNPNDFIFGSSYNTLKYYTAGSIPLTVGSITTSTILEGTANHNLGFFPFYEAFINISGSPNYYPASYGSAAPGGKVFIAQAFCSTSSIYFKIDTNNHGGTETYVMYYKIFKNNLGL